MASCSPLGKTQGREWGVSPRRLLSTGQPRTANPAGEHDISAKKASLPRHCPYTSLRGPTPVPTPETLDCSSTVPPEGATPRFREGPSFRQTVDRALYSPPSLYGGCGTPTTPSSNLVRAEPGAEKPPRWYDAPTTPTRAQPACTWGMGLGPTPSFFLAGLAALPGDPSVHEVPSGWRRRHSGGVIFGTTHPRPRTKGGCGHRLCATWPVTRNGSHHLRAPVSSLAPHAPLYRSLSFLREAEGMKSLCPGSSMGEPAPPGRVLTPPQSEACPE